MVPVFLLLITVSCVSPGHSTSADGRDAEAFAAPTDLTATLATPVDVDLHWKNRATWPACYFVEFAFERHPTDDNFTMLEPLWPDTTNFRHDKVAPETHFAYRVRPLFGQPSSIVAVTAGAAASDPAKIPHVRGDLSPSPSPDMEGPLAILADSGGPGMSIRNTRTAVAGVPLHVTATAVFSNAVDLRWQDRAADEDGYLVDISVNPTNDFRVCALLPPGTTSFRKAGLPSGLTYYFRVRAFFYGKSSNLAEVVSGVEPAGDLPGTMSSSGHGGPVISVQRQ